MNYTQVLSEAGEFQRPAAGAGDASLDAPTLASIGAALLRAGGHGLLVLGPDQRLVYANPVAVHRLADGPLRLAGGALEMERVVQDRLSRELATAETDPGRRPIILTAADGVRSKLLVIENRLLTRPWVMIWIADFAATPAPCDWMAAAFDLTPAEMAVVSRLAAGEAADRIAAALGNAVATIRSHLFRIYDKTSTASQGQLISLAHRAPPAR